MGMHLLLDPGTRGRHHGRRGGGVLGIDGPSTGVPAICRGNSQVLDFFRKRRQCARSSVVGRTGTEPFTSRSWRTLGRLGCESPSVGYQCPLTFKASQTPRPETPGGIEGHEDSSMKMVVQAASMSLRYFS